MTSDQGKESEENPIPLEPGEKIVGLDEEKMAATMEDMKRRSEERRLERRELDTDECMKEHAEKMAEIRSKLGSGPWDGEADRVEFKHAGFDCLLLRNFSFAWCGYVGIPKEHVLHGVEYGQGSEKLMELWKKRLEEPMGPNPSFALLLRAICGGMKEGENPSPELVLNVHGGLTYSDQCAAAICHKGEAEGEKAWWFGFDCSHCDDWSPGMDMEMRQILKDNPDEKAHPLGDRYDRVYGKDGPAKSMEHTVYRTQEYVQEQTKHLADQLAAIA